MLTKEQFHAALVESGGVTEEEFEQAAVTKEAATLGIDTILIANATLTDEQLAQLMGFYFNVPSVNLRQMSVESEVLSLVPEAFARHHELLPLKADEKSITVATSSPNDVLERSLLEKYLRKEVIVNYATPTDIREHLFWYQKDPKQMFAQILEKGKTEVGASDTTIIELVTTMIDYAFQGGASDIHIEPETDYTLIRFRQDGMLHDIARLPKTTHENIITRLKVLARLATDEHRAPQDGKIRYKTQWGEALDLRLSVIPTTHAEKAVMRILSEKNRQLSLASLGFSPEDLKKVSAAIRKPWGMILVTGPTGSGKTTTLYAMLQILNKRDVNITTIEDPVEYQVEGINQIPVNEKTGLTFAKGLRSIVRQDPDIIMVGEIRDSETANIAVNAAMTGHLVLSTLHTNDSATAFPRLSDMGVENFLIASTVNVVIAQRLVRKICMNCIQSVEDDPLQQQIIEEFPEMKEFVINLTKKKTLKGLRTFKGKGCHVCHQSGYNGRGGIFEVMIVSEAVKEEIMKSSNADQILATALREGMLTMLQDGLRRALAGQTTLEEVLRVTRE